MSATRTTYTVVLLLALLVALHQSAVPTGPLLVVGAAVLARTALPLLRRRQRARPALGH